MVPISDVGHYTHLHICSRFLRSSPSFHIILFYFFLCGVSRFLQNSPSVLYTSSPSCLSPPLLYFPCASAKDLFVAGTASNWLRLIAQYRAIRRCLPQYLPNSPSHGIILATMDNWRGWKGRILFEAVSGGVKGGKTLRPISVPRIVLRFNMRTINPKFLSNIRSLQIAVH